MKYEVMLKRKVAKRLHTLPLRVQKKLIVLANDLRDTGPAQPAWQNYSKPSPTEYHCVSLPCRHIVDRLLAARETEHYD